MDALRANNFGFFSPHDYPYVPGEDPYLVAVLGGSVAQWFALQGAPALVERLRQAAAIRGRRIEIVNFARGAFKQPQALQVLAYFLAQGQRTDFVVNLDGFNDVALSSLNVENGIDPSQPSAQQLLMRITSSGECRERAGPCNGGNDPGHLSASFSRSDSRLGPALDC